MSGTDHFRLTLSVADVARSVAFYRTFFDREPAHEAEDSARFEMTDPPLMVNLVRRPWERITVTGSAGLRLPTRNAVLALRDRLHRHGLKTHTQECTHCGYNEQFKIHVPDPDGNDWSVYAVARQIHPSEIHRCLEGPDAVLPPKPVVHAWEYQAGMSATERVPHADGTLDEVRFSGAADEIPAALLADAFRALRPGGTVQVGAGGNTLDRLHAAGFRGLEARDGTVHGSKPDCESGDRTRLVLYKGPFRQTRDDSGNVYPRGRRVAVDEATWTLLRRGSAAEQFLFLFPFGYPAAGPVRPPEQSQEARR